MERICRYRFFGPGSFADKEVLLRNPIRLRVLSLLLLITISFPPALDAADDRKIGVVDFKQVLENSIAGKAIKAELKQRGDKLKQELEELQVDLKAEQKRNQQEAKLWSKQQKEDKARQFQKHVLDFRKLKAEKEKEFNAHRFKLLNELQLEILAEAEELAKKGGYDLIIEKQSGKVLWLHRSLDVTAETIKQHDRRKHGK